MSKHYLDHTSFFILFILILIYLSGCNEDSTQISEKQNKYKITFISFLNENNIGIFVMNSDGANQERLTSDTIICLYPEWSPNGQIHIIVSLVNRS